MSYAPTALLPKGHKAYDRVGNKPTTLTPHADVQVSTILLEDFSLVPGPIALRAFAAGTLAV